MPRRRTDYHRPIDISDISPWHFEMVQISTEKLTCGHEARRLNKQRMHQGCSNEQDKQ
jgi:hypothetical protein